MNLLMSNRLRVVVHDGLGLWEIDPENFYVHIERHNFENQLLCSISSTHSRVYGTLSVQFCRVEGTPWLRFFLITCRAPRGRLFLVDIIRNWESIQSPLMSMLGEFTFYQEISTSAKDHSLIPRKKAFWALHFLNLFRTTRISLHWPFRESSLSIRHWMGCRCYFVASRLEVCLDEDDYRSSSRVREHESFLLVSQLHLAIQTLWSRFPPLRMMWTNRLFIQWKRVSPFCLDLHVRLCLCLWLQTFIKQVGILVVKREMCINFLSTRSGRLFFHNGTSSSVEESFSAGVPRSLAEVRRVFIHDNQEVDVLRS